MQHLFKVLHLSSASMIFNRPDGDLAFGCECTYLSAANLVYYWMHHLYFCVHYDCMLKDLSLLQ